MLAGNVSVASLKLGSNIRTLDWAPQTDILGHPNIKAFVTQGGALVFAAASGSKLGATAMLGSILTCKALMPAADAGINSLYEAMHNAVPVACIPINTDQPYNRHQVSTITCTTCRAVYRAAPMAVSVDTDYLMHLTTRSCKARV